MGAAEAARYLTRHGDDRVAKLVLVAPTTPLLAQTVDNPNGVPSALFDDQVAALRADRPSFVRAFAGPFFGRHVGIEVSDAIIDWGVDLVIGASPLASIEMFKEFPFTDSRSDLAAISVPTLVIHGDSDAGAPLELTGRPTAELIATSELKIYERAAHGLFITHRDALNADIEAFAKT
jgi:pimeloyl-ACP methyl ester carboxylesterase